MPEFDEEAHPRDERGRFGPGGSGSAAKLWAEKKRAAAMAGPLADKAEREGGFTVKPGASKSERTPSSGVMVSRDPKEGLGHVVEIRDMAKKMAERDPPPTEAQVRAEIRAHVHEQVQKWLEKSLPAVAGKGDHYLGGWFERDSSGSPIALHLDVSQRFEDRDKAISAGRERNQLAVWDIGKMEEVSTGGTGR